MIDRAHWIGLAVIALAMLAPIVVNILFRRCGRPPESGGDRSRSARPAAGNSSEREQRIARYRAQRGAA